MSFTEKKFKKLTKDNRLKKLFFAVREYLSGKKTAEELFILWEWSQEDHCFLKPSNHYEWGIFSEKLLQVMKRENLFLEEVPVDDEKRIRTPFPATVVLDNIRSPYNVGSFFRSAEAFGIEEIVLCGITPAPEQNPKVAKTAKEALVPYAYYQKTENAVLDYKKKGFSVYGIEKTSSSRSLGKEEIGFPFLLIFGNEEFGISKEVLGQCDQVFHIDLFGKKNSINVSTAGGIVFYELRKNYQEKTKNKN
ncbi:MAG TPA: hypothetical protein DHW82_00040 [Spirochaetia bacterium]|nr:hypothetical protein [Spirochaetia bacterium]